MSSTNWTWHENTIFEVAMVLFPENTPNRWQIIAQALRKSVQEVKLHYVKLLLDIEDIESPKFKNEMVPLKHKTSMGCVAVGSSSRSNEKKRSPKAPVPWSDEENRQFALGLKKHGVGAWRLISKDFVKSRTSQQCASHYQKYEKHKKKDGRNKRPSTFDNLILEESSMVQSSTTQKLLDLSRIGDPQQHNTTFTGFPVQGNLNEDDQFLADAMSL